MGKGDVFEDAIADFSIACADQNERDQAAQLKAVRLWRIDARMTE
jgi:hypothetical protein